MDFQGRQEMSVVGPECRLPRDSITPEIDGKAEAWALSSIPVATISRDFSAERFITLVEL
jgi:hypothetical protein